MNSVESEHVGVYDENETLVATAYRYNQSHSAKPYSDNYYVGKYNENGDIFTLFCDNGFGSSKRENWNIVAESDYSHYLLGYYALAYHPGRPPQKYVENLQHLLQKTFSQIKITGVYDDQTLMYVRLFFNLPESDKGRINDERKKILVPPDTW